MQSAPGMYMAAASDERRADGSEDVIVQKVALLSDGSRLRVAGCGLRGGNYFIEVMDGSAGSEVKVKAGFPLGRFFGRRPFSSRGLKMATYYHIRPFAAQWAV